MKSWTWFWLLWAALVVGGFFIIELPAVFNEEGGDTLTEHIVTYVPGELVAALFGALVVWLSVHFGVRYARKRKRR